jgi:hypothetical protein
MGVVATGESALGTSLRIRKWDGAPIFQTGVLPTSIDEAYDRVSKNWELDGTEFHQATQVHAALRQLMCGFYYKWEWPNGRDEAWIHASKIWSQVSNHLMRQGTVDSDADAQRYVQQNGPASDQRILAAWLDARKRPGPTTVPVWLSPHLINAVREWTNERMYRNERGVVWYEFDAIGEQMRVLGWPVFGGGTKDALSLLSTTDPVIVCSRQAHGTGKNLQDRYWWNLVLTVMPNGKLWEQMLGRTHRPGQPHDTVFCDVNVPDDIARKAWQSAREDACYIEQTTGMPQKILYGANSVLM